MNREWLSSRRNDSHTTDHNASVLIFLLNPAALASSDSELSGSIQLLLTISCALWWFVVVSCAISLPFYWYAFWALWRQRHRWRHWQLIILSIILADTIMLCVMFSSLLIAKYFHDLEIGPILCKAMVFSTNVAAFFTNWCWVLIWGRRFLAIYQPLRQFRYKRSSRKTITSILLALLVVAVVVQVWGILFTTEYNVDGMVYCELDHALTSYATIKWVVLAETVVGYGVPFLLIVLADALVLYRAFGPDLFTTVTSEQLSNSSGSGIRNNSGVPIQWDTAKIISEHRMKERVKRKHSLILRCVMAASLDMLFNLPDYSIQIIDNFISLREDPDYMRLYYSLEAATYVLYFLQYPMIAVYIRWLLEDYKSQSDRSNKRKEVSYSDNLLANLVSSKSSTDKYKRDVCPCLPPHLLEHRDLHRGRSRSVEGSSSLLSVNCSSSLLQGSLSVT
uniref:G-protein coupled receptors family 1 profile domain-containing protein n=1 Tax=Plectus sambesii TaxID=2011161 RepID=A0A914WIX8_9BILA